MGIITGRAIYIYQLLASIMHSEPSPAIRTRNSLGVHLLTDNFKANFHHELFSGRIVDPGNWLICSSVQHQKQFRLTSATALPAVFHIKCCGTVHRPQKAGIKDPSNPQDYPSQNCFHLHTLKSSHQGDSNRIIGEIIASNGSGFSGIKRVGWSGG